MSQRNWITAFALGLILFAALGQAQEKTQGEQGQAQAEQSPAQTLPIPLPVDVIEDDAEAEARQRSEAEARQREIDDLAAQQGMNTATQAMNEATQRMALYTRWSTILIAIGTGLLIITLWLTRQANKAAQDAVAITDDIGKRQLRAYVCVAKARINVDTSPVRSSVQIRNYGSTPAYDVEMRGGVMLAEFPITDEIPDWSDHPAISKEILGPGADSTAFDSSLGPLTTEQSNGLRAGRLVIIAFGQIRYRDAFDKDQWTKYRYMVGGNVGFNADNMCPSPEGNEAS